MDAEEFRMRGREMIDYIADYLESVETRRVTPDVEPGYLRNILPTEPPKQGECFTDIMRDVDTKIMPGMTHWQHPGFHAYYPEGYSFPSILGGMLADGLGAVVFSWVSGPACTELEMLVVDWLGKMMGLPNSFLHESGQGGGVIHGSASECIFVMMLAARHKMLQQLKKTDPQIEDGVFVSRFVAYTSKLAHSCVEKAGMLALIKVRTLEVDDNFSLQGRVLEQAIQEDRKLGLIPVFVCATIGTTAVCSFDNISEIGEVCSRENIWLHIDAAYAGSALICPEYKYLLHGFEFVTSINVNPHKWLLVHVDCSVMWVRDKNLLTSAMAVDPLYLQHQHNDKTVDFRHWGIPLSRRFRALKLWFVIRSYGIEGLQKYIREHVRLAKLLATVIESDPRFEVVGKVTMGLVCFRLKGHNSLTAKLIERINSSGQLFMVPSIINDTFLIRFTFSVQNANERDIHNAWKTITAAASTILNTEMNGH